MFSLYSSFVGLIFSETLYSTLLIYIIHDKGYHQTVVIILTPQSFDNYFKEEPGCVDKVDGCGEKASLGFLAVKSSKLTSGY